MRSELEAHGRLCLVNRLLWHAAVLVLILLWTALLVTVDIIASTSCMLMITTYLYCKGCESQQ